MQLPTLGSPVPQQMMPPEANMGSIQAQIAQAQRQQQLAQMLIEQGYVKNSGALGAIAQVASAWKGKKLDRKAGESVADALKRKFEEEGRIAQAKAEAEAKAAEAAYQRDRADKRSDKQFDIDNREPPKPQWINRPDGSGGWATPPSSYRGPVPPAPDRRAPPSGVTPEILAAIEAQESGGNVNAVSPKGARGPMQLMPDTQRDPGFGVAPARDNSPEENRRVGADYFKAMLERYQGNQSLALAAYNAGPGRVDDALKQAQFDPDRALAMLPRETQDYVPGVLNRMGGGSPAAPMADDGGSFQQVVGAQPKPPSEIEQRIELARKNGATDEDVRRMLIGREGAAAGSKPMPVGALKEDLAVEDALGGATAAFTIAAKHLERLGKREIDPSLSGRAGASTRNFLNMGNEQSANLTEMQADKTHLVNESLRLNKGVQTEGDAQRATKELMDATDYVTTVRAFKRIVEINKRAVVLQQHKREMIRRNYGQGGQSPEAAQAPASDGWGDVQEVK